MTSHTQRLKSFKISSKNCPDHRTPLIFSVIADTHRTSWWTHLLRKDSKRLELCAQIVSFIPIRLNNRLSNLLRRSVRIIRMSASWPLANGAIYVYRYQGKMNVHKDAVVLLSYPEKSFGEARALRVFISTHTELAAQEILNIYAKRRNIEVFFRRCKQKLAFDKCQLRKKQGITRMWLILSLIHFLCRTVSGCVGSFDEGYHYFRNCVLQEILLKMPSQRK